MFLTKKEAKSYFFEPYEKCPCQSGMNYKFCCYQKSRSGNKRDTQYSPNRILFEANKIFSETDFKTCFAFNKSDCSDNIIGAHSLQNNGVLDKIAVDNHVYNLNFMILNNNAVLEFKKIGKNQASKFTGFCKYHDEVFFSPIEDQEYTGTAEQNFLFAFRAFCFEFHRKKRLSKHYTALFQKHPYATRDLQICINYRACQLDLKDKEFEYNRFKNIHENSSFNQLDTFTMELPYRLGFTGTTAVAVAVDISGEKAADIYNYDPNVFIPSLYISVIPRETTSLIIVSRHVDDNCYENLIKNLRRNTDQELLYKYISFCLAEYSENIYFSPDMVDKLSQQEKQVIISAFSSSLSMNPESRLNSLLMGFRVNLFELIITKNRE